MSGTESYVLKVFYRSLNRSFPIQLDAFILVNEAQQIQQYDMVFRRWGWVSISSNTAFSLA